MFSKVFDIDRLWEDCTRKYFWVFHCLFITTWTQEIVHRTQIWLTTFGKGWKKELCPGLRRECTTNFSITTPAVIYLHLPGSRLVLHTTCKLWALMWKGFRLFPYAWSELKQNLSLYLSWCPKYALGLNILEWKISACRIFAKTGSIYWMSPVLSSHCIFNFLGWHSKIQQQTLQELQAYSSTFWLPSESRY